MPYTFGEFLKVAAGSVCHEILAQIAVICRMGFCILGMVDNFRSNALYAMKYYVCSMSGYAEYYANTRAEALRWIMANGRVGFFIVLAQILPEELEEFSA